MYDNESLESASTLLKKRWKRHFNSKRHVMRYFTVVGTLMLILRKYKQYTVDIQVHADKGFFFKSERIIGIN